MMHNFLYIWEVGDSRSRRERRRRTRPTGEEEGRKWRENDRRGEVIGRIEVGAETEQTCKIIILLDNYGY